MNNNNQQHAGPPMFFVMPMMRDWIPNAVRPWIYVLQAFCFQFTGGMYLGALDAIRGTTGMMIEDVMFLLYVGLAGMAVWFPMLFRMKFHFTNKQLLCTSSLVICLCNLVTMHFTNMPILMVACFLGGVAKIQGTFESMSIIQLWITPKRDFGVFFPVLHIILLTAIEGSGFAAAWFAYHFTWQMMHVAAIGLMCIVQAIQILLCRPFCPMQKPLPLKGIDIESGILISILMLILSYIFVYGDYKMWFDNRELRLLIGASFVLFGFIIYRLTHVKSPYIDLKIFSMRNVFYILIVTVLAEFLLGCEHTYEEIFYAEVMELEELTKEKQYSWAFLGIYAGVVITLLWLKNGRWKVWKLFGIAFVCIFVYAILMYTQLDANAPLEQYHLAIIMRGCAMAILSASLMWSLQESIHDLSQFFMGLFVFNIIHMYFGGAMGYGIHTTIFSHYLNDNIVRYGSTDIPCMISVTLKQAYGIMAWISLAISLLFFTLDIHRVRTNLRKVPDWKTYGRFLKRSLRKA